MTFENTRPLYWIVFLGIAAAVMLVWGGYAYWVSFIFPSNDWAVRGQFGDSFGALNTFFSGLAFAALVVAVILQTKELALQRQELQETREELRRSADAQERTERALLHQAELQAITVGLSAATARLNFYGRNTGGAIEALQAIQKHEEALENVLARER